MFEFEKGSIKFIRGGKYPHCHTVFVDDERRAFIDASSHKDVLTAIDRERQVDILIASHGHEDHTMYNALFPRAQFWVHEQDAPVFLDVENLVDCYAPETEAQRAQWKELIEKVSLYEPRKPDRLLRDGEVLDFGNTHCRVIHTPGHTPGHCAFHFLEDKVLYLGDLDLTQAGPYYGDVNGSLNDIIESLNRIATIEVETYLTAHGEGIFDGDPSYVTRYLGIIEEREERLIDFLSGGAKSLEEITEQGIIYGPPRVVAGFWDLSLSEKAMMKKHLERLKEQGRVVVDNGFFLLAG
ncbi:MAG: MBL fold metallo-hydrolase [Deltaproteobacteria bacterium]|nr:MAG: MBL fold metallo-hydrolase [Deltaproteobacteria bacterium]